MFLCTSLYTLYIYNTKSQNLQVMKKLFIFSLLIAGTTASFAQTSPAAKPVKKNAALPSLRESKAQEAKLQKRDNQQTSATVEKSAPAKAAASTK